MPAKKTKLFQLDFDFKTTKQLEYAFENYAKFKKDEKTSKQLKYRFNAKPIDKWPAVSVVKEKGARCDVYRLGLEFAVSKKVKTVLEKSLNNTVEFLPLKVVGEFHDDDDYDQVYKLKSSKEELFLIHPTAKVQMAVGTKSEDHPGCREYLDYGFRPDDISDLPLFRPPHSGSRQTLVSQAFRDVLKAKGIKGFSFTKIDWIESEQLATKKLGARTKSHAPVKTRGTTKSKVKATKTKESNKVAAPRTPPALGNYTEIHKFMWPTLVAHWNWVCDASVRMSEDKPRRPKISKPLSQSQLAKIKKKTELPREFENVLLKHSSKVDFFWSIDPDEYPMPKAFEACTFGGGPLWDAKLIPEMAKMAAEREASPWRLHREGLDGRLPFLHVGNGDLIAFCMRKGNKNCPIVYLSHDDDRNHDRQIGLNFADFIVNWTFVGCVDLDVCFWEPFYSKPKKKINGLGREAAKWRKYMENAK